MAREFLDHGHGAGRLSAWQSRVGRNDLFLSEDALSSMTKDQARAVFKNVYTGRGSRRNVDRFLTNDIDRIRKSLLYLIYRGPVDIGERFTDFFEKKDIRLHGAGVDFASTILHAAKPTEYAIWNKPSIDGLVRLALISPKARRESIGTYYRKLNQAALGLMSECAFSDLEAVDGFLYCISKGEIPIPSGTVQKPSAGKIDRRSETALSQREGPPDKTDVVVGRFNRDTEVVRRVKNLEGWTCQVCREPIVLPEGKYCCEIHHIRPLGSEHNGTDRDSNTICLCPNHHAAMENGAFYITPLSREIVWFDRKHDLYGLPLETNHLIDSEALRYHRDTFCKWADKLVV